MGKTTKEKLSLTLDRPLVRFLDSLPGDSRSAKLDLVLRRYRRARADAELRCALAAASTEEDERLESDAWRRTMLENPWNESPGETSGPSNSSPTPSRGRRSSSASTRSTTSARTSS
jgi:hypothetical protein